MEAIKKPIVAWLIAFVIVGLSTGYLIVFGEESSITGNVINRTDPETVFYNEFDSITFATLNDLYATLSDDGEALWLYGSRGDYNSMIMLQLHDLSPITTTEETLLEILDGMVLENQESHTLDVIESEFLNRGISFNDTENNLQMQVYLFALTDNIVLNVVYGHYATEYTDLSADFQFILHSFEYNAQESAVRQASLREFSFRSNQVNFEYTGVAHGEFEITVGGEVGFAYHANSAFRFYREQLFYVPVTVTNPITSRTFSLSNWQLFLPNGDEASGTGGGFDDTLSDALGGALDEIPRNGSRTGNVYFPYVGDGVYKLVFGGDFANHQHSWRVRGVTVFIEVSKEDQNIYLTYRLDHEADTEDEE